jgi:CheY-like chemotaxis protein
MSSAAGTDGGQPHQVLIVDDHDDTRESLTQLLRLHGCEAIPAASAEDALRQFGDGFRPCTIILDLNMPGIDGWALFDQMRADPELAPIPVIVVSGHLDEMTRADDRQACRFFLKPAKPADLIKTIGDHCARLHTHA